MKVTRLPGRDPARVESAVAAEALRPPGPDPADIESAVASEARSS
jgi:hypothetical protein